MSKHPHIGRLLFVAAVLGAVFAINVITLNGCDRTQAEKEQSFLQIGDFTIKRINPDLVEARDGAGRILALIPRNTEPPQGYTPDQIVRVPVRSVVAYGNFDVSALRVLGVLEDVLVGVTTPAEQWYLDDVKRGMASGKIVYLGDSRAVDFERLKRQNPELVLTWDHSAIPMLNQLKIPCVITSTPVAMCLNARMRYVQFLAPFFQREPEAEAFFLKVSDSVRVIRDRTANAGAKPKVMWGDIYEKRVLVEPGNAWVGELVGLAQSDYLFEDVYGTSCIEISVERFLHSGDDADILFTYRTADSGATSKAAIARLNPLLAKVKPLIDGKVYAPLPHYVQSGHRLDEILTEIAAILHPECYPNFELRFFEELPDVDPAQKKEQS